LDNTTISNAVVREVLPNETKYAIAREYGISVADIDANPVVASEPLKIGQQLIIPSKIESK
jgi:LysM repeat protein